MEDELKKLRDKITNEDDILIRLILEISLYDSVHDFENIFYDKIPKSNLIKEVFGLGQPNLLLSTNFTYVCDKLIPYLNKQSLHENCQQNNKVSTSSFGVLPAFLTKSKSILKANIEKHYLYEVLKILFPGVMDGDKLDESELDDSTKKRYVKIKKEDMLANATASYDKIVDVFQEYAQFEEGGGVKHIPLVVDVQKVLFKLMRANIANPKKEQPKLAYCLNREMTNDAAGKLDFTKKSFISKIGSTPYFVDTTPLPIQYNNDDNTILGFETFTMGPLNFDSKPQCEVKTNNNGEELPYTSVINDNDTNSKRAVRNNIFRKARENLNLTITLQNESTELQKIKTYLNDEKFKTYYKNEIIEQILLLKNGNPKLKEYADEIFYYFLRKRLGDQLQAFSCLKKRSYSKLSSSYEPKTSTDPITKNFESPIEQEKPFIFYSYDVIACAYALANKIPCIYEDSNKNMHCFNPSDPAKMVGGAGKNKIKNKRKNNIKKYIGGSKPLPLKERIVILTEASLANPLLLVKITYYLAKNKIDTGTNIFNHSEHILKNISHYNILPIINDSALTDVENNLFNILVEEGKYPDEPFTVDGVLVVYVEKPKKLYVTYNITDKEFYYTALATGGEQIINKFNIDGIGKGLKEIDDEFNEIYAIIANLNSDEMADLLNPRSSGGSRESLPQNKNMLHRLELLKSLLDYEFKLIFYEEVYEMDFDTQDKSFPHMAENMELYCVIEELKKSDDINIYEFLSYLSKKSEKTSFESDLLIHLEDIYNFLGKIVDLEKFNTTGKEVRFNEFSGICESLLKKDVTQTFRSDYFTDSYYKTRDEVKLLPQYNTTQTVTTNVTTPTYVTTQPPLMTESNLTTQTSPTTVSNLKTQINPTTSSKPSFPSKFNLSRPTLPRSRSTIRAPGFGIPGGGKKSKKRNKFLKRKHKARTKRKLIKKKNKRKTKKK
jgi:hypothetical protein